MRYVTKLLNNNSVLPPTFLLTLRGRALHAIWVSTLGTYNGLETLKPRRNLRPVLWAFYSVVQGLICKNLNNLLGNLNIYFSKDMNLDRNGSLSFARTQKNKIKLCKESKNEMDLPKIISLDTTSSVRAKFPMMTSKHQII